MLCILKSPTGSWKLKKNLKKCTRGHISQYYVCESDWNLTKQARGWWVEGTIWRVNNGEKTKASKSIWSSFCWWEIEKTQQYQQTCLLDLRRGHCSENKTKVNADRHQSSFQACLVKESVMFTWSRTTRVMKMCPVWGHNSKHGFDHAEKTEVSLFIGSHAVQNYDKNISIWPQNVFELQLQIIKKKVIMFRFSKQIYQLQM